MVSLAEVLNTTVDNLLSGGKRVVDYKGKKTIEEMKKGINCLLEMGQLLGRENLLYRCAVEGIDEKMNMEVEEYLRQPYTYEAMVAEAAIQCMKSGYYMDVKDIEKGFISEHWRTIVGDFARKNQE